MNIDKEKQRIENISQDSKYAFGVNLATIKYSMDIFQRFILEGSILELGPAEGIGTGLLVSKYKDITVVEGSKLFCEELKKNFPSIIVIHSLFEEFVPNKQFDNIILGHVLEHVENPSMVLARAKEWLTKSGKIMCAVPNSNSIHRQAAVIMGLLKDEKELNQTDLYHGHRRVYDLDSLQNDFLNAGLCIEETGGYWLKPVSNAQIEKDWTEEMIAAFMILGEKYPAISAEIYIVASLKKQ